MPALLQMIVSPSEDLFSSYKLHGLAILVLQSCPHSYYITIKVLLSCFGVFFSESWRTLMVLTKLELEARRGLCCDV